ncbi:hypothetical protein L228DRAFT_245947 [Xylona heveae TC161]|uniref:Uncharacterized protein n=1 Tax=Xylona heveae (strain CBS 132557 / TC161) TaxID=1328760 RepID=A0A165HAC1_XYLHT|nr:hypothetical protein L228DRAFT_245947 [Xylona heveae TC161]KZF23208.1 hypothetical protein L228DRAFT_245947 [Xylona heveae TC161]
MAIFEKHLQENLESCRQRRLSRCIVGILLAIGHCPLTALQISPLSVTVSCFIRVSLG